MIAAERQRQVDAEGWTPEHDAEHVGQELARAAVCYVEATYGGTEADSPWDWPWDMSWWKPTEDPIRNLAKAGALIAAEIDRLQRTSAMQANTIDVGGVQRPDPSSCRTCGSRWPCGKEGH